MYYIPRVTITPSHERLVSDPYLPFITRTRAPSPARISNPVHEDLSLCASPTRQIGTPLSSRIPPSLWLARGRALRMRPSASTLSAPVTGIRKGAGVDPDFSMWLRARASYLKSITARAASSGWQCEGLASTWCMKEGRKREDGLQRHMVCKAP